MTGSSFQAGNGNVHVPARLRLWNKHLPLSSKMSVLLFSLACSAGAGLAAVAFLRLTNVLYSLGYDRLAVLPLPLFATGSLVIILSASLVAGILLTQFSPEAAGSGIPELKAAYWKEMGFVPLRQVVVKFLAGTLSLAGGASLGREGPTVFLGGGLASNIAGWLGVPKRGRRTASLVGAAAGLAAAFNTPLAAITFVLEEILGEFGNRSLGAVVFAAVIGAFTIQGLIGPHPAFVLPNIEQISASTYLMVPVVATTAALLGVAFQVYTIRWRSRIRNLKIPAWLRPACGGIMTWALACAVFAFTGKTGIFSLGYGDLSDALHGQMDWRIAGAMVFPKLLATVASYSWGGCGGIFSPTLFIGGMTGLFLGGLAGCWLPLGENGHIVLAAVGMSACLAAVVRAPLTCLLIVFEMTHQFAMVPAIMCGVILSQFVARLAGPINFYDALLLQNGHELIKIKPPQNLQAWQDLPVTAIANPRPIVLTDITPAALRKTVETHPFQRFPLKTADGSLTLLSRSEIIAAIKEQRPVRPEAATLCYTYQTIREAADLLVQASSGAVFVVEKDTDELRGLLTLHDLLRAQAASTD